MKAKTLIKASHVMRSRLRSSAAAFFVLAVVLGSGSRPAEGLTINLNFLTANPNNGEVFIPSFDPTGSELKRIVRAAADHYEDIIEDPHTLTIKFWWNNGGGAAAVAAPESPRTDPLVVGRMRFDGNRLWYLDPDPNDDSEFDMGQKLFSDLSATNKSDWFNGAAPSQFETAFVGNAKPTAPPEAQFRVDLLTVAFQEMGHLLGVPSWNSGNTETADGDWDTPPEMLRGTTVGVRYQGPSGQANMHTANPSVMSEISGGMRLRPSAADIFAMASTAGWTQIDLRRQDFLGGTDWNTPLNWEGNSVPDADDDAYVRHGGTVWLTSSKSVANLVVDEGSWARIFGAGSLFVADRTTIDRGAAIRVSYGTHLDTNFLDIGQNGGAALDMGGGTAQIDNDLTLHPGGDLRGSGTVEVRGSLNNNGTISVTEGTQTLSNLGTGAFDLDGTSENGVLIVSGDLEAHLVVDGPLTDAFDGTMHVNAGSATFTQGWNLGPGGTLYLNEGSTVGGSYMVAGGRIEVNGSATVSSRVFFQPTADVVISEASRLDLKGSTRFRGGSYTGTGTIRQNDWAWVGGETEMAVARYDMDGISEDTTITIDAPFRLDVDTIDIANNRFDGTINIYESGLSGGDFAHGRLDVNTDAGYWIMNGTMNLNAPSFPGFLYYYPMLTGSRVEVNGTINADGRLRIDSTITLGVFGEINTDDAATVVMLAGVGVNEIRGGRIFGPGVIAAADGTTLAGSGMITAGVDFHGNSRLLAESGVLNVYGEIRDVGTIGTANDSGVLYVLDPWNTAVASNRLGLDGGEVQGGTITNDGFTRGRGTIVADFVNNTLVKGPDPASSDWLEFLGNVTGCGEFTGKIKFWGTYDPTCLFVMGLPDDGDFSSMARSSPETDLLPDRTATVSLENVEFADTAVLSLEIGGLEAGTDFDQLNISGDAMFGGTVNLIFFDGFAPDVGNAFDLIYIDGSIHGSFATTNIFNLDPGYEFTTEFAKPGVFRITTVAVPEPSTLVMLLSVGLVGLLACVRRRRSQQA